MIASLKGYGRFTRTLLAALGGLLILGIVGSLLMGIRARSTTQEAIIEQATVIADRSLTLAFSPSDLSVPVGTARATSLTEHIGSIVMDPSEFESVTLFRPDGMILYSTQQSLIGTQLPGEQDRIMEALKGEAQTRSFDGNFSVLLPLRFRSGAGGPAAVEFTRPDAAIRAASGPWNTNALFLFALLVILGVAVFGFAKLLQVASMGSNGKEASSKPAPGPGHRPITVPAAGLREEAEARRRAEERARAAEERLVVMQEQYKKTLGDLQASQATQSANGSGVKVVADPKLEERALRAEGQLQTLQQQIVTLTSERERLMTQVQELVRAQPDPGQEVRLLQVEREALGLRAQLEGANEQLSVTRKELEELSARADAATELQVEVTSAHVELMRLKDSLATATTQLKTAEREAEDTRVEMRGLRNEEQRAAMLEDELRSAKAELDSLKASHRADLVEREAELEEKVRATREEFQKQLAEIEDSYRSQFGQKEVDLADRIAQAEGAAGTATREMESMRLELEAARAEAASREKRLLEAADELVSLRTHAAEIQSEIKERTNAVSQSRKESEELRRSFVALQADLVRADETVETLRTELETERARAADVQTSSATAERETVALSVKVEKLTQMLEAATADNAELNRRLQDFEARRQLELADDQGGGVIDDLLRVTQDRLAGQTEKLIAAEDRAKELESELTAARDRLDVTEGELRTHQMSDALREMREHDAPEDASEQSQRPVEIEAEDRRASTPFMKELSLDAKKALSRINGIAQLLKHKKDAKDQAQLIKQLASCTRRLDHTVSDIVEADNLAQGTIELQVKRTDLEALVKRVVEESGIESDHEVKIVADPIKVRIDPLRTEQILAGLLRASGDRTSSGKTIVVRILHIEGGALMAVEDPGAATDAALSPVVRRFAEVQGGWARVESRDDGGTAFRVFLPDAASPEGAKRDEVVQILVDPNEEVWESAAAEQILSRELRRLAELPSDDR